MIVLIYFFYIKTNWYEEINVDKKIFQCGL